MSAVRNTVLLASALASQNVLAQNAFAQDDAEDPVADHANVIVVTARGRAESLMDVPVAVTALSDQDVSRYAATDLAKIATMVPEFSVVKSSSGSGASFNIRGISSSAGDPNIEQAVTVDIDGVQIGRGRLLAQGFFDLEQIQVMKGPQALFFGKNSTAGVVSIASKGPGSEVEGYLRTGYEFVADEWIAEGALGGPVTDTLGVRLAVRYSDMKGWLRNVATPRANPINASNPLPGAYDPRLPTTEELTGRLTVKFDPSDRFDLTLKVLGGTIDSNGESGAVEVKCQPGFTNPVTYGIPDPTGDCRLDGRTSISALPPGVAGDIPRGNNGVPFSKTDSVLSSLTMNLQMTDAVTLTSTTGFYKYKLKSSANFDYSGISAIYGSILEDHQQFTQQLRLTTDFDAPINATIGAYFEDVDRTNIIVAGFQYSVADPITGFYHSAERVSEISAKTYSLFGQLRWDITEAIELAGGVRWTKEKKTSDNVNQFVKQQQLALFREQGLPLGANYSDDDLSPEVTISWRPTSSFTAYAAYKTGFKSGGLAAPQLLSPFFTQDELLFRSETVEGGEVGVKGYLLDGALRYDLTAYYYTFDDLQLSSYDAPTASFFLKNAAKARSKGVEGSLNWNATEELSVRAAFAYSRARYVSFPGGACYAGQTVDQGCVNSTQDLSGTPLPRAPEFSGNFGVTYDAPLNSDWRFSISGDMQYKDSYITQENANPLAVEDSMVLLNGSLRAYQDGEGFELAIIGRNLTNERYAPYTVDRAGSRPGELLAVTARPREILIQGTYRF